MTRFVLNQKEAAILKALKDEFASFPELSVATRLTPSQVRKSVESLEKSELVKPMPVKEGAFIRLTPTGLRARQALKHNPMSILFID